MAMVTYVRNPILRVRLRLQALRPGGIHPDLRSRPPSRVYEYLAFKLRTFYITTLLTALVFERLNQVHQSSTPDYLKSSPFSHLHFYTDCYTTSLLINGKHEVFIRISGTGPGGCCQCPDSSQFPCSSRHSIGGGLPEYIDKRRACWSHAKPRR